MNRDTANIFVPDFNFTSMQAGTRWQADLRGRSFEIQRAANCPTGAIERREDAVSGRLHQAPPIFFNRLARYPIVFVEQATPRMVAYLCDAVRRIDDIGEQHSSQNAIKIERRSFANSRYKLLDITPERLHFAGAEQVIFSSVFDEFCVRYLLS